MKKQVKPTGVFWTKPHSLSPSLLSKLQNEILNNQKLREQLELIEILNAETRLQLLYLLSKKSSICVGDIADVLRLDYPAVSHQLNILRKENLVLCKKRGKVCYYSLAAKLPKLITESLAESGGR